MYLLATMFECCACFFKRELNIGRGVSGSTREQVAIFTSFQDC